MPVVKTQSTPCDSPDGIPNIIRDEQRPGLVDRDANRPPHRVSVRLDESCEDIYGLSIRFSIGERNEDYAIATEWLAIPGTVLSHKHPLAEARW